MSKPTPAKPSKSQVELKSETPEGIRVYELTTDIELRDNLPADKCVLVTEGSRHARCRSGNLRFDALFAMAIQEAAQNSVSCIRDADYAHGQAIEIDAYKTGEKWNFVWTRDLAYALDLGLAAHDVQRATQSLRFKASKLKQGVPGELTKQIVQDTGSGGSYPVSTDRVVWALGAHAVVQNLHGTERAEYMAEIYPIIRDTIEQDRVLIYDAPTGLYRGEQSFLDWREQTYPQWTEDDTLPIAMSKALSVNALYCFLLGLAADYACELDNASEGERYRQWEHTLRRAIQEHFYDADTGLFRTYLLSEDGSSNLALPRYDLLGQCLAILFDITTEEQARQILDRYPTGPHGPAVVWPQESDLPIYHNQGIWPFVTAYWIKAAVKVGHAPAVDAGVKSLIELAAANLSNMENFDFISGKAYIKTVSQAGPTINSRRQLWSVAGYLHAVQNAIFGLNLEADGIHFQPFITRWMRNEIFGDTNQIILENAPCLGVRHTVVIHLPAIDDFLAETATITRLSLNGSDVTGRLVSADELKPENHWEAFLDALSPSSDATTLRIADVDNPADIYAPESPKWSTASDVTTVNGLLQLNFTHPNPAQSVFDIFRNGTLHGSVEGETTWQDPDSADFAQNDYAYQIAARCPESGHVSHPTRSARLHPPGCLNVICAKDFKHHGGRLADDHHLENWGLPNHEISLTGLSVSRAGCYAIQLTYANGAGPINTGIACSVKRVEIVQNGGEEPVAVGYFIMPQTGDWNQYRRSNVIQAELAPEESYNIRIYEDNYSRNMSYLASNENYTALPGGGAAPYNFTNIADLRILYLGRL
ncbi:MAG: amylo-alpha-1,6-glucosidase [Puniceicoccales bacterium]